ncbi:UNKNOWN [Stylonychia lemnae]|uniref:Peptidase M14 domain-containing protein n=1 Tax=Stylonychia lemnae TaxID=5949 RepID=A0A078B005_STYLE|nr:UNKNOWN [Stylonychia lemnae]|eukprot:CDW87666.1 UNKNOWN [Stylonychia lemnae]
MICQKCGDSQLIKVSHIIAKEIYQQNLKHSVRKYIFENDFMNYLDYNDFKKARLIYAIENLQSNQMVKEYIIFVLNKSLKDQKYPNLGITTQLDKTNFTDSLKFNISQVQKQFQIDDSTLRFDSLIESGNLERVYQNSTYDYTLIMRGEYNPIKSNHMQWFYTHIYNFQSNKEYTFRVIPFTKFIKFLNIGQRVWLKQGNQKWQNIGEDYQLDPFYKNDRELYQLSFKFKTGPNIDRKARFKLAYLITSRVHSGETHVSFLFNAMLKYIISDEPDAIKLRQKFIFLLIPCMNPEGVILGNSRVNVLGYDLNRQWLNPDADLNPEINSLKKVMTQINNSQNIAFQNYSLSFTQCDYKITDDKLGTGRVVAWDEYGITNSFTFENSFFGYTDSDNKIQNYTKVDYLQLGSDFVMSLLEFQIVAQQLEKDLVQSNGWLRPNKLLQITGESALELAKKQAQNLKLLQERKINIDQYKDLMKNDDYYQMIKQMQAGQKKKKRTQQFETKISGELSKTEQFQKQQSSKIQYSFNNKKIIDHRNTQFFDLGKQSIHQMSENEYPFFNQLDDTSKEFDNFFAPQPCNYQQSNQGQNSQAQQNLVGGFSQDFMKIQISMKNSSKASINQRQPSSQIDLDQLGQQLNQNKESELILSDINSPTNNQQINPEKQFIEHSPLKQTYNTSFHTPKNRNPTNYNNRQNINQASERIDFQANIEIQEPVGELNIKIKHIKQQSGPNITVNIKKINKKSFESKNQNLMEQSQMDNNLLNEVLNQADQIFSDDENYMPEYDWRNYFSVNEIQKVAEQISRGEEPLTERLESRNDQFEKIGRKIDGQNSFTTSSSIVHGNKQSSLQQSQTSVDNNSLIRRPVQNSQIPMRFSQEKDYKSGQQTPKMAQSQNNNRVKLRPLVQRNSVNENVKQSMKTSADVQYHQNMNNYYVAQKFLYSDQDIHQLQQQMRLTGQNNSKQQNYQRQESESDGKSEFNFGQNSPMPKPEMKFQISVRKISQDSIKIDNKVKKPFQTKKIATEPKDYQDQINNNIQIRDLKQRQQNTLKNIQQSQQNQRLGVIVSQQKSINHKQPFYQNVSQTKPTSQDDKLSSKRTNQSPRLVAHIPQLQQSQITDSTSDLETNIKNIDIKAYNQNQTKKNSGTVSRSRKIQEQITLNQTVFIKEQYPLFPIMNNDTVKIQNSNEKNNKALQPQINEPIKIMYQAQQHKQNSNLAFCTMFFKQTPSEVNSNVANNGTESAQFQFRRSRFKNRQNNPSRQNRNNESIDIKDNNNVQKQQKNIQASPKNYLADLSLPIVAQKSVSQPPVINQVIDIKEQYLNDTLSNQLYSQINTHNSTSPKRKPIFSMESPKISIEQKKNNLGIYTKQTSIVQIDKSEKIAEFSKQISQDELEDSQLRRQIQDILVNMRENNVKIQKAQAFIGLGSRSKHFRINKSIYNGQKLPVYLQK